MHPVRLLRAQLALTQCELAQRVGTSQPTIALYESGGKSPSLATLRGMARSLGLELVVAYVPQMTREDHRSLAYHRAVARRLRDNPVSAVKQARGNLQRIKRRHPGAGALLDRWRIWLGLSLDELVDRILDPGMAARDMRQVTPFAGLLQQGERARILKDFRDEHES